MEPRRKEAVWFEKPLSMKNTAIIVEEYSYYDKFADFFEKIALDFSPRFMIKINYQRDKNHSKGGYLNEETCFRSDR